MKTLRSLVFFVVAGVALGCLIRIIKSKFFLQTGTLCQRAKENTPKEKPLTRCSEAMADIARASAQCRLDVSDSGVLILIFESQPCKPSSLTFPF